jgi:hypothetical protein
LTSLKDEYPKVKIEAFRVKRDGSIKTVKW